MDTENLKIKTGATGTILKHIYNKQGDDNFLKEETCLRAFNTWFYRQSAAFKMTINH